MNRISLRLGLVGAMLVAGQGALFAQDSTTGAITGFVTDASGAVLVNARVTIDGGRGQSGFVTDAKGSFRASGLIPGQYQITVTAPGFETSGRRVVTVSINTMTPVRITLAKTASAVVEVVASSTAIDTTTQTSGSTFTSTAISSLPIGRAFSSVVNLAPGVASSGIDSNNPSVGGSSGLENQYVIDGVNTTQPAYGANGSYSIVYGSLGTGINTDFISEVQIKSFGLDAEFGGSTGGMVNAVTKTGDNTLHAQVFAYFDIDSLQSRNKVPPRIDPTQRIPPSFDSTNRTEFGFTVAGPLIKDKLWYFVGYNPIRTSVKRTQVDPAQPFYGRQAEAKNQTDTYYGKLNWAITNTQNLEFSIFGDPGKLPFGPNVGAGAYYNPTYSWESVEFGGRNWSLKYNGVFFSDFLVEARFSQANNKFRRALDPQVQGAYRVTDAYTGVQVSPGPGFIDGTDDKNKQTDIKLTKIFGDFELKVGYSQEKLEHKGGNTYQGPAGFVDPHVGATGQPYSSGALVSKRYYVTGDISAVATGDVLPLSRVGTYYRITRARTTPPLIPTEAPWKSYFIQGKYNWNNRLFIKAGFRWDEEDMKGLQSNYKFKAADAMAPRMSITWDPEANGRNKIYAFYGKYFEKVPLDLAQRSLSAEVGVSRSDFYNINAAFNQLSNPIQTGVKVFEINPATGLVGTSTTTHFTGSQGFLTPVLPGTKLPFTNEYVLGWDMQPMEGMTISNRFIHRNAGRVLEDLGIDGGNSLPYYIGNPGENTWQLAAEALKLDPTLAGSGSTANWPTPKRDYWAYEFEMQKQGKHWSGFINIRLSRLEGNYEGLFRNDNGQSDPNITSLFDFSLEYLKMQEHDHGRGLTGEEAFASGPLPNDRAVIANAGVTYSMDNGLSLSVLSRFQTGTPLSKFYGLIDYDNAGELAAGGRGAQGRTPSTINFDFSGQYVMKFANKHSLTFRADVFNLFNVHKPTAYDQNAENSVDVPNANYGNIAAYQTARRIRLGVKYQF